MGEETKGWTVRSKAASHKRHGKIILFTCLVLPGCTPSADDDAVSTSSTPDVISPTPTVPTPTPDPRYPDWTNVSSDSTAFWEQTNIDTASGGYFTGVARNGTITNRNKWTRCVSRQVYGFTRTFQMTGNIAWLDLARTGVRWLLDHALDTQHGGFYQQLDETGHTVVSDERTMFDLAYALNGLAVFFEVTHDLEVEHAINATYDLLEARAWDSEWGGYYKALTQDMSSVLDDGKDFNALVDPATAFLFTLYAATASYGDDAPRAGAYKERLRQIGFLMADHLVDPDGTGWIGENFTREWEYDPANGPFGDRTLCGHNLKAAWTLVRIHMITGEWLFLQEAETLLEPVIETCLDRERGGVYDMVDRATNELVYGEQKTWWQQEEGILALQLIGEAATKSYYTRLGLETRSFYLEWFPDPVYGEVFSVVEGDGAVKDDTKGNEWKSAYHSVEVTYFGLLYDAFFVSQAPVTLYYHFDAADVDRAVRLVPVVVPNGRLEVSDPVLLDGEALTLQTSTQVVIPAGAEGLLEVVYDYEPY